MHAFPHIVPSIVAELAWKRVFQSHGHDKARAAGATLLALHYSYTDEPGAAIATGFSRVVGMCLSLWFVKRSILGEALLR